MRRYHSKVLFVVTVLLGLFVALALPRPSVAGLDNTDCVKCHEPIVSEVGQSGQQHKTAVTCLDCHLEHPPAGVQVIPECAMCHEPAVKPHYAVENCVTCHNPHDPLEIKFAQVEGANQVCASCHVNEGKQLTRYPSLHSELDCSACHNEHGSWLSCLDCHDGHSNGMDYATCLSCHQPHKPTVVTYDLAVPNNWCGGCHENVFETLAANQTKHHDLSCVYCHKDQHMMVPMCETCHYHPHNKKLHKKYPDCRECHYGPHALDKEG